MKNRYKSLKIVLFFATLLILMLPSALVLAQEPIEVTDQAVDYDYREQITFDLSAESQSDLSEVDFFYRVGGQLATSRNSIEFTPGNSLEAQFVVEQTDTTDDNYIFFPPGTEVEYWWKLIDVDGNELKTERETLTYLDTRYEWQQLDNERLTLYWYEGDEDFGQALFNRADVALDTLEADIGISLEDSIKIFIYNGHDDLLGALSVTAQEWTGGVAFTNFGTVVIGIYPGQLDWGLNAMTHEMTHLVIHQATDNPFAGLPRWVDEGIAVYNENQDELDDDFRPMFEAAVAADELLTLQTLSSPFPADPKLTLLAYGQSGATIKHIVDTHGSDKMAELLDIFSEGAIPDEALLQALGLDTVGLDNEFRASLGLPPLAGTEPAIEQSDNQAATSEDAGIDEAEEAVEPVEETEAIEEIEAAEPVPTTSADTSTAAEQAEESASGGLPCVGGIVFMTLLGWSVYRRV